jgi:hypothetical protein
MTFAKRVFTVAGLYGLVLLGALLFMEQRLSQDYPPAITHPEYFYGFLLVTISWQLVFLLIGRDPLRYRPLMPLAAVFEKFVYAVAVIALIALGRTPTMLLGAALIDTVLGVLFLIAYAKTRADAESRDA